MLSKVRSAAVFKQDDHPQMEGAVVPRHVFGSRLVKKAKVNTVSVFLNSVYLPLLSTGGRQG